MRRTDGTPQIHNFSHHSFIAMVSHNFLERLFKLNLVASVLVRIIELSFVIAGFYILIRDSDAKHDCNENGLWFGLLVCTHVHLMSFVYHTFMNCTFKDSKVDISSADFTWWYHGIRFLLLPVWSFVMFFAFDNQCMKSEYFNVFQLLQMEVAVNYIYLAIYAIYMICLQIYTTVEIYGRV